MAEQAFRFLSGYGQVRPRAAETFRQHDYRKAAELYASVEGKLTPAELKKLEYARKQM